MVIFIIPANSPLQNEVLHTPPLASIPKNILRAPPLDPSSPSPAHAWLPLPPTSARLRDDPDPDFAPAEATARELELLLAGPVDKINRRTLAHLSALSADLMDLGARYNAFSLNEPSRSVAAAIERVGQAADTSYIESDDLAQALTAAFVEPMRETAQFAAVVRTVLRYRALKCLQENMTRDQLAAKHSLLAELEASELEARRIDSYLSATGRHPINTLDDHDHRHADDDATSVDSDFPPARDDRARPSAAQGAAAHRKSASTSTASTSSYLPNRLFDRLSHAVHGFVDADPERSRRDQIGKTKESLVNVGHAFSLSPQSVSTNASPSWTKPSRPPRQTRAPPRPPSSRTCVASAATMTPTCAATWLATLAATLTGRGATSTPGRKLATRSIRSRLDRPIGSGHGNQEANDRPCSRLLFGPGAAWPGGEDICMTYGYVPLGKL